VVVGAGNNADDSSQPRSLRARALVAKRAGRDLTTLENARHNVTLLKPVNPLRLSE
jgi:hypothetical protein